VTVEELRYRMPAGEFAEWHTFYRYEQWQAENEAMKRRKDA
jgi:hypothetical protein